MKVKKQSKKQIGTIEIKDTYEIEDYAIPEQGKLKKSEILKR